MSLSAALHGGVFGTRWTPLELGSSLVAWYDASVTTSVTTATGGVSQWDDLSGNGNHATQGTSANRPGSVTNGVQFVRANSDRLVVSGINNGSRRCYGIVGTRATSTDHTLLGGSAAGLGLEMANSTNKLALAKIWFTRFLESSGAVPASQAVLVSSVESGTARVSIDGTATTGNHSETFSGSEFFIGATKNTSNAFANHLDGTINEIVIADPQTTAVQQILEGYLAWKWSLTGSLPSDHPYKNIRP